MTRRPFRPGELEDFGTDLEPTVEDLERYLADSSADPAPDFVDGVIQAVAAEPTPRRGLLAGISGAFNTERGRMALVAATMAVAILAVVAAGQLSGLVESQVGDSPQPSVSAPPVPTQSPSLEPSPEPSPSASDDEDDDDASPDASDDEDRSPSPSGSPDESDNSGPGGGGGGGDSSGPGSGDGDDSSGPGGG
jgi:uncharacterized membrane protein YgcG